MTIQSFYDTYWKEGLSGWTPRNLNIAPDEKSLVEKHVKPGMRVLEIGCGDGRIGTLVTGIGAIYEGVDISEQAVVLAAKKNLNVRFCDVSGGLPFDPCSYDIVISFEVLEHLFRPDELGGRVHAILKHQGCFIGSVPNIVYFPNRIALACGIFSPGGSPATSLRAPWRDPHIRFFSPSTLQAMLLREAGFSTVTIRGARFDLTNLPVTYRSTDKTKRLLSRIGKPVGFLGKIWPSMFSYRIYFSASL